MFEAIRRKVKEAYQTKMAIAEQELPIKQSKKVALVFNADTLTAQAIINELAKTENWTIIGISQKLINADFLPASVSLITADFSDKDMLRSRLKEISITHVFYAVSYTTSFDIAATKKLKKQAKQLSYFSDNILRFLPFIKWYFRQQIASKLAQKDLEQKYLYELRNLIEILSESPHQLSHISFFSSIYYYGNHIDSRLHSQKSLLPFKENAMRLETENWSYALEDFLVRKGKKRSWNWTIFRPSHSIGFGSQTANNLALTIAIYANLCRELGTKFIFPGSRKAYYAMQEISDIKHVAEMAIQTAISSENKTYNATNGDTFSWAEIWPLLADYFNLEMQINANFCVQNFLATHENVWQDMTQKYALQHISIKTLLVNTDILDSVTLASWHTVFGMGKSLSAGFRAEKNTPQLFIETFKQLKRARIIP
ncbi:MAG: hypothetical protein ACPG5B_04375 [Chitinophagales bacterium]